MSRYIPMPAYPDIMPVDISFVFEEERPAGKRGFVHAVGEDLRFEDGTLARFWGVNFNGGACFPSKEYAPKVARRLAMAGVNLVRFHQLDAEWDTPNIFSFHKGKRVSTTRKLDPQSMDALDYLVSCLKEEGIYCYLDMNTYRHFKEGDGVDDYESLIDEGKPWNIVDPRMIELQKEYADQLWNHYNPYTKLLYKDDPVFALTEIVNEDDLFTPTFTKKVAFKPCLKQEAKFRTFFKEWLEKNGKEYDWEHCDIWTDQSETMIAFKMHLTEKFFQEMYDHMRNVIGVRIPITGTNWTHGSANVKCHRNMDFTDSHHYFYDWAWGNLERVCKHQPITATQKSIFPSLAKMKLVGKPFFVSEWDMPWPNSYRAEGPIYYAAVGALQNWSGFAIHTYAYGTRLDKMDILGREQSSPVAGVPYREGIFSVWNDPAKFGLFYHAALITRRCDIAPANQMIAVKAEDLTKTVCNPFEKGLEQHRLSTTYEDTIPEGYDELMHEKDQCPVENPSMFVADNGQMWRDLTRQIGAIDTDRTKVVYGSLSRGRRASVAKKEASGIALNGLTVEAVIDFGVIALSSLTNESLENSDNILLSAIGRARNDGAQFDGNKMLEIGHAPILAEVIEADIHLKTNLGDRLSVWGVNAEGYYAGKLETTYEDGVLSFHIGDQENPACYYLIVAE